jgi:glycine/D-amino acid oxidase-like deaminating enzyme
MKFDTATDRSAFARAFDVCVIGAGPAGITLARRLADAGAEVALMEAGALEITAESQEIYEGEIAGLDYFPLDAARLRFFGGTSNHWGGWCRALDAHDFDPKPFNDLSGWPIGRIDLDPHRAEADRILDLPPETLATDLPFSQDGYDFRRFQFRWSTPTHDWARVGFLSGLSQPQQKEGDQRDGVLDAHGVFGGADETGDLEGLFDPAEE